MPIRHPRGVSRLGKAVRDMGVVPILPDIRYMSPSINTQRLNQPSAPLDTPEEFGASTIVPPPVEVSPRASVLREAESLITGDRNKAYGSPTQNFTNTAEIWTALLRHKLKDGETIAPAEVASLMIGLKLARTVGEPKRDNWVDMAGYAGCGYEASEEGQS